MSSHLAFILVALICSFLLTFAIMPYGIRLLYRYGIGKNIRNEGLVGKADEFFRLHGKKRGTPTMGGAIMLVSIIILIILSLFLPALAPLTQEWFGIKFDNSLWSRQETYVVIFTLISVGVIGIIDDYMNVRGIGRTQGLSARVKMVLLILMAGIGAYWFFDKLGYSHVHLPFLGDLSLGWLYMPLFILVVVSGANSVNITDGLDGLAGGLLLFQFLAYGAIAYIRGLYILSAFCMILAGVLLAFLWFNIHPAQVFMGDTWSLAFGATGAVIAFMTDTLIAYIIMSSVFIFETLSVMIQIASKKLRNGKKVFKIAPFHHHLEAIWWQEETIVMRLWLVGMILSVIGIMLALSI